MQKRFSGQFTEGKISRIFSHAKYGKNKVCKRCKSRVLYRLNDQRHECSKCHFRFSLRTNTYLKHSRAPLDVWHELLWWFVYGFTANKTAKETELSQKLVHRCFIIIRKAVYGYEESNIKPVFGTVEVDETYVGARFKNRRKRNREYYRRVEAVKRGRGAKTLLLLSCNTPCFSSSCS